MFPTLLSEFLVVVISFIVWILAWWGHVSGRFGLAGDAFYCYWDDRFFLDNIAHGVFPLWNPDYSGGVPWNFFLRRMGEFNPFYWIVIAAKSMGVAALQAHIIFLVVYYFIGLLGFWLLAKIFLKDPLTALGAYLLLLFAWGAQIFYCFEVLQFVPLVWFFYFLFAFNAEGKRHQFLGIFFCLSLILTTYVPFFALTIISVVFLTTGLFFPKGSWSFLKRTGKFARARKFFTTASVLFFFMACMPAASFYIESQKGGFIMPTRHLGSTDASAVAATSSVINKEGGINYQNTAWDIIAYAYVDRLFKDQKALTIGDFNISYLFFIVPLLAIINPFSRRTALLLVAWVLLILMNMTEGRLYPLLLHHVFFYHYMRMLQLFLWLGVIPLAILMVMEQLKVFIHNHQKRRDMKTVVFVAVVHALFFMWLLTQGSVAGVSFLAVGLSLAFFVSFLMGGCPPRVLFVIFWLAIIVQPIIFAGYIAGNSTPSERHYLVDHLSRYEKDLGLLPDGSSLPAMAGQKVKHASTTQASPGYYENPWMNDVRMNIDSDVVVGFISLKLLLFDNTETDDDFSFDRLGEKLRALDDHVYLPLTEVLPEDIKALAPRASKAQVIFKDSPEVKVLSFDVNTMRLLTRLDRPRFLLWTNGYHPAWKVYIDGHENRLLRADFAFKGIWLPAGEHRVLFRFFTPIRYAGEYLLLFMFLTALGAVLFLGLREGFLIETREIH